MLLRPAHERRVGCISTVLVPVARLGLLRPLLSDQHPPGPSRSYADVGKTTELHTGRRSHRFFD
eukprot:scaffold926_cov408-Prasinococcus_capsulatus_cf.AAC.35